MSSLLVITGASRGIGLGIVQSLQDDFTEIINLSRSSCDIEKVINKNIDLTSFQKSNELNVIISPIEFKKYSKIVLINNAGRLGEIVKLQDLNAIDLSTTIQLNLSLPMMLCGWIIKNSNPNQIVEIVNITSGAASGAYHGWSAYCASKAGLEIASRVISEENKENSNFRILNVRPGVVDTNMQGEIRASNKDDFANIERFKSLKENGDLYSIEFVGDKIKSILKNAEIKSGETIDIRLVN